MGLHLYYLDKDWEKLGKGCADNYNSRNFIDKKDIIELEGKGVWTASFKISIRD